jgi:hypothetical protein
MKYTYLQMVQQSLLVICMKTTPDKLQTNRYCSCGILKSLA